MEVDQERFQVGAILHVIHYASRKLSLVDAATMGALFTFRTMFGHDNPAGRYVKNLAALLAKWFDMLQGCAALRTISDGVRDNSIWI